MTENSQYDVIVVLGGGRTNDGELTELSKQRLDKGIEMYKAGQSDKITAHGNSYNTYSKDCIHQEVTGAEERRRYLVAGGVKKEDVIMVEDCRDTITEAFASRKILREMDIKSLALVTSIQHLVRSLFIFSRVFGDEFKIDGVGVPCGNLLNEAEEAEYLTAVKQLFDALPQPIPDPDLETWYSDHAELYEKYKQIHDKYHPPGRESQAYMGVKVS